MSWLRLFLVHVKPELLQLLDIEVALGLHPLEGVSDVSLLLVCFEPHLGPGHQQVLLLFPQFFSLFVVLPYALQDLLLFEFVDSAYSVHSVLLFRSFEGFVLFFDC